MGVSTNGTISFGVVCEEDTEFPWDTDRFDGDIDDWWREENGFQDVHHPWTPEGNYAAGWQEKDPRFKEYNAHRHEWTEANPVPVATENYCSGDYPMYAITIPGVGLSCCRGEPEAFKPAELTVSEEQVEALKAFLEKYKIAHDGGPRWLLTSYWG